MDQKEFLRRVLPSGHHYIAYPSERRDQNNRIIWNHSPFDDPNDGVRHATRIANRNTDVYFAVASFKQARVMDPKLGKEKSYRKQANVAALKSLFLDIDFKNYESPEATVAALGTFLKESKLELPSIIVRSGGGLHVYWTFARALTPDEWQPLADGLAGVAENLGLKADLQCTIDSARILRMPGTRNLKYDPPALCEVQYHREEDVDLDRMATRLRGVTSIRARTRRPRQQSPAADIEVDPSVAGLFADSDPDDLGAGAGYAEATIRRMVGQGGCPLFADMLARGGDGDSRDLWNNMLLLTAFAADGREMAHLLSEGDPRYTREETDAEFDMKLADKDRLGPTTCDTFAACSPIHCATCPHRGKIRSPLVLGRERRQPQGAPIPEQGEPSFVEGGCTYAMIWARGKEGAELVKVQLFDVALERPILYDIPSAAKLSVTLVSPDGRRRTAVLECGKIGSRDYVPTQLGSNAIPINKDTQRPIEHTLMAWISFLRNAQRTAAAPAFGWSASGFSLGGNLYTPEGDKIEVDNPSMGVDASYEIRGSMDVWSEAAAGVIADPRPEMQIILATAFAAPLLEFTEQGSTAVVIRSPKSGVGKTSVMRLARAAYGSPTDMAHASDTPMSVETKLTGTPNMPWYWDEVKIADSVIVSNTIYQVLQGRSKSRLRPDGTLRDVHRISGMLVMATNISMTELMQEVGKGTDAGGYRVLELEIPPRLDRASQENFSSLMAKLRGNHGHAGEAYARYLAANRAEAEKVVHEVSATISKAFHSSDMERFWMASIKVIIAGAVLATKAGICTFDVHRIVAYLQRALENSRQTSTTSNSAADLAGRIWRHFSDRSLITDEFHLGVGFVKPAIIEHPIVPQRGAPRVRLAYMTDTLLITREGAREFAFLNRYQPDLICSALASIGTLERTSIDRGTGATGTKTGREHIYVIRASDVLGDDEVQSWVSAAASRHASILGSSSGSAPPGSTAP